jgi:uncharacterized protein (DUF433 family)
VTEPAPTEYPHIVKSPDVRGGKPCIEGTRISVVDVVRLHKQGLPTSEMRGYFAKPLTPAQVHAALAYYYDHTDEIDRFFTREEGAEEDIERGPL